MLIKIRRALLVLIIALLVISTAFISDAEASESKLRLQVEGVEVTSDEDGIAPFIDDNNRTIAPVRLVCESIKGASVEWISDTERVIIKRENIEVSFIIDENEMYIRSGGIEKVVIMDTVASIINNRTFVPVRYVAEAFGMYVSYDASIKLVSLSFDKIVEEEINEPSVIYANEVFRLINIERESNLVKPFKKLDGLNELADIRAYETSILFEHERPYGESVWTVFVENGFKYSRAGENIAKGYNEPAEVVRAWMDSPGHRKNILDESFEHLGVGVYIDENGWMYCTQLFYTPIKYS